MGKSTEEVWQNWHKKFQEWLEELFTWEGAVERKNESCWPIQCTDDPPDPANKFQENFEMNNYQKTLKLAQLISLEYVTEGQDVWRRNKPYDSVPWRPYECEADLQPIREWVAKEHPEWWFRGPVNTPAEYCDAILREFDEKTMKPLDRLKTISPISPELDGGLSDDVKWAIHEIEQLRKELEKCHEDYKTQVDAIVARDDEIKRLQKVLDEYQHECGRYRAVAQNTRGSVAEAEAMIDQWVSETERGE